MHVWLHSREEKLLGSMDTSMRPARKRRPVRSRRRKNTPGLSPASTTCRSPLVPLAMRDALPSSSPGRPLLQHTHIPKAGRWLMRPWNFLCLPRWTSAYLPFLLLDVQSTTCFC